MPPPFPFGPPLRSNRNSSGSRFMFGSPSRDHGLAPGSTAAMPAQNAHGTTRCPAGALMGQLRIGYGRDEIREDDKNDGGDRPRIQQAARHRRLLFPEASSGRSIGPKVQPPCFLSVTARSWSVRVRASHSLSTPSRMGGILPPRATMST